LEGIVKLDGDIWQVDLQERGIPGWSSAYFMKSEDSSGWMLVETGASSSVERLLGAANYIGIPSAAVKYIGVTHVHVDHAGALGVLARHFQEAEIWVHHRGIKHLADPERLIEGARAAYGEQKMGQYGEIIPVPQENLCAAEEGVIIPLGGRPIEVWETPGHARHHVCFYDSKTKGLFSGDAAGVYLPGLSKLLHRFVTRPATPGPDFDGDLMLQDLYRISLSKAQILYFTHFGAAYPAQLLIELVIGQLLVHMQLARDYLGQEDASCNLCRALELQTKKGLLTSTPEERVCELPGYEQELLLEPLHNSADGLLSFLEKKGVFYE